LDFSLEQIPVTERLKCLFTLRKTCGSKLMDKNPFDIVDTMKVKNGIQMDGTHKMDSEETDFGDLSSY